MPPSGYRDRSGRRSFKPVCRHCADARGLNSKLAACIGLKARREKDIDARSQSFACVSAAKAKSLNKIAPRAKILENSGPRCKYHAKLASIQPSNKSQTSHVATISKTYICNSCLDTLYIENINTNI
jgi:hypothetical protein